MITSTDQSTIRNNNLFNNSLFTVKRKPFKLIGKAFDIFDDQGNKLCYAEVKMLKIKDEIEVFTDHLRSSELLKITGDKSLGMSSLYEVVDSVINQKIGSIKLLHLDKFLLLGKNDEEIGILKSSNNPLSVVRLLTSRLVPKNLYGEVQGIQVCIFRRLFNPFATKFSLDFSEDQNKLLDRRLGLAAGIYLSSIDV